MVTGSSYGERRQLTVVFSDIVGSTELSAQLDPEDWHDIVTQYHQTAANAVKRLDGHVAQYLGDGILILFGYPKAQESDAERAIRAGLSIIEEINSLNDIIEKDFGKRISVRVGIHTGEVMVRPEEADSGNIFGEAPNVAARVQSEAKPNTVCISAATHRIVAGFFVVEDLGPHILKGVPEPMQIYRVDRTTGVRSRLSAGLRSSLTPFVGREDERNTLMNRWSQAQKGKGQLVMVTGEAGIGKSRLLQQFKNDLGGIPHTWIEGESSQYEQDTPFAPTLDMVENAFQWTAETLAEKKIDELERSFSAVGLDPAKSVPLMATLFGISIPPNRYPPILLSPEQQRVQLLQTLVDWVIGTSRLQPTVLVVEDLHFADPSTLEEFVMLGDQVENAQLMLVFTARPRFQPPWPTRSFHTLININRLEQDNIKELITGLLGKLVAPEVMKTLVNRTDGNPLFAEELSETLANSRNMASPEQQIPSTLHDLLMSRLDYLGSAKETAQIGSVLGRTFSHSLLASIANNDEEQLQKSLLQLTDSGLVFAERSGTDTIYTFKHALVQESAYNSLLKSRRRELHRTVAASLNQNFSDLAKQRPELLAHHLTHAGDIEPAVEAWQAAAEHAAGRAAWVEALQHYKKALELLNTMPESDERDHLELPIQLSLGHVFSATIGFGSTEEMESFSRAREISEKLGDSVQFLVIMLGLWGSTNSRSEINASKEISREFLRLAEKQGGAMMLTWAHESQAIESYAQGDFAAVGKHFQLVKKFYKEDEQTWAPFDPLVTTSIHASLALRHLGLVDQARETLRQQYDHAQTVSPANVAMAHLGACSLHINLQEPEVVLKNAEAMQEIGTKEQLPSFLAWGNLYHGIAWIQQGEYEKGIAQLSAAVSEYLLTGTHSSLGEYLGILAQGYMAAGDHDQALITINNAFGATPEELMHLPTLHRTHADILWKQPSPDLDLVEKTYRQSIEISQQFGTIMEELISVTHLGRLLQSCGRSSEALALLTPLYAKFTESFDTVALKEAKELLDELS